MKTGHLKTGPKGPSKYTPAKIETIAQDLLEYAQEKRENKEPIFIQGFCVEKNIPRSTLTAMVDKTSIMFKPELLAALSKFKDFQEFDIAEGALQNRYDPGFAFRTLKNVSGWRDETHIKSEHIERKVVLVRHEKAALEDASRDSNKILTVSAG